MALPAVLRHEQPTPRLIGSVPSPAIPPLLEVQGWMQLLPAIALLCGRNRSRPVLWIAGAFAISLAGDLVGRYVAHRTGNNHIVVFLSGAVTYTILIIGMAEWQVSYLERLTLRIMVIPCLLIYGGLMLFVENTETFSSYAYPFYTLVVLGASAWTLLRRAFRELVTPLTRSDWFFVLSGVALLTATTVVSTPIAAVLMARQRVDLMIAVWEFRAACSIVALLVVSYGMLLPPAKEGSP